MIKINTNEINAINAINAIDGNPVSSQILQGQKLAASQTEGGGTSKQIAANLLNLTNEINQTNLLSGIAAGSGAVAKQANLLEISSGLNNGSAALLAELAAFDGIAGGAPSQTQAQNTIAPPQPNTIRWEFQGLLDAMFKKASNGTGQLNQSQFANLVAQMDPQGSSGVNAALLFSQLDPDGAGLVTQSRFDFTLQDMLSPNAGGGNTVTGAHPLSSPEISALQYQNTQSLLNTMMRNSATNHPNSLLNILT